MPASVTPTGYSTYLHGLTAGMLQLQGLQAAPVAAESSASQGAAANFQQFLAQAIDQTVALQKQAEAQAMAFLSGEMDDLHTLMIAQEKAALAFQLTLQIRNKLVEAYQEVMRMQI